jgi:hypothetical protein
VRASRGSWAAVFAVAGLAVAAEPDPSACREGERAAVVFFVLPDCPVSNALAPAMGRIARDYGPKGVRFTFAYVDPALEDKAADAHAAEYSLASARTIDREHALVKRAGAEVVPEAAVFLPDGALAYCGRINNQFTGFGDKRQVVTEHDLIAALDAVLAGKPAPEPKGKAVGCYIADYAPEESGGEDGSDRAGGAGGAGGVERAGQAAGR